MRLRQRLNTLLLQWFLLLVLVPGTVWILSFPGIRQGVASERKLLAETVARAFDAAIADALQHLDRLAADLPTTSEAVVLQLHAFRLQSPFNEATYLLDEHGAVLAADPPDVVPIDRSWLGPHESVTALLRKTGLPDRPLVAIVQPFVAGSATHYLVSELDPAHASPNALGTFLRDLPPDAGVRVSLVDDRDAVIASTDAATVTATLPSVRPAEGRMEAPLRYAGWHVVIDPFGGATLPGLRALALGLALAGLLLALGGVLLAGTLSRSIVSPIGRLSAMAESMRAGNLSTPIAVTGDHEIRVLADTLDEARVRLSASLDALQAFNDRLEDEVAARTATIAQQNEQRKVLVRKMLTATEDERRRFARELHDEIAQLLTVIQLSLHNVREQSTDVVRARELLTRTQTEIHRIIHDLRPAVLDDLGLAAAMRAFAEDHLRGSGLDYALEIDDDLPSLPDIETVVFRIYQELVTNTVRHAQAEHLSVQLYATNAAIVLEVEDDGRGFDPDGKTNGAGVTGMRERAAIVNGTIRFDSEPGAGTHAVLEVPRP